MALNSYVELILRRLILPDLSPHITSAVLFRVKHIPTKAETLHQNQRGLNPLPSTTWCCIFLVKLLMLLEGKLKIPSVNILFFPQSKPCLLLVPYWKGIKLYINLYWNFTSWALSCFNPFLCMDWLGLACMHTIASCPHLQLWHGMV